MKQFFVLSYLTQTYEAVVTSIIVLHSKFLRTDPERFLLLKCDCVARYVSTLQQNALLTS